MRLEGKQLALKSVVPSKKKASTTRPSNIRPLIFWRQQKETAEETPKETDKQRYKQIKRNSKQINIKIIKGDTKGDR